MIRYILLYLLYLKEKLRLLGKVSFRGFTVIHAFSGSRIVWGKGVKINSHSLSNLIGMHQRAIVIARDGGQICIGDGVEMSGMTLYALERIEIGNGTMIGANTIVMDNDFHPLDACNRHSRDRALIKRKPVLIGKECFIGMNTIICKGTVLGDRCVVGAGSVVSGKFPSDCVLAGNPARIIRSMERENK